MLKKRSLLLSFVLPNIFTRNTSHLFSSMTKVTCSKCLGEGKLYRPPSRKAVKRQKQASHDAPRLPPRIESCTECQASGLIDAASSNATMLDLPTGLPRVAICGGGIAGLALATACRQRKIPHTVYERDKTFEERSQGYGLTMQQASKALRAFGIDSLPDGITSTKHVVHKADGSIVGEWGLRKWGRSDDKKAPKRQNVHIARQALRKELLVGNEVNWNHRLLGYDKAADGSIEMKFQVDDKVVVHTADLLVGADGIRSQVRRQWMGDQTKPLRYLDCIVVLGICRLSYLSEAVNSMELMDGNTVFQTADGNTRVYCMPYSRTEYMWQLSFPIKEADALDLSQRGPKALQEEALARCGDWHTPVPDILRATPCTLISGYPVYDRDLLTSHELSSDPCITLIGDACHPMSPFKGQGANQALLDALSLTRTLYREFATKKEPSLVKALESFEEEMVERSSVKVKASAEAALVLHSELVLQEGNQTRGAAARVASTDAS